MPSGHLPPKPHRCNVMPAAKHGKIKGPIKEYDAGKMDAIPTYTITSKTGGAASHTGHKEQEACGRCRVCKIPQEADRHGRQVPCLCR